MGQISDRVRERLMEEIRSQKTTQRALAEQLHWTPSKLGKILVGPTGLDIDDLAAICGALRLSLVEVVRDQGMEFCADLRPSELRILERIRQVPNALDAIMLLLDVRHHTRPQTRYASTPKKSRGPRL